MFLTTVRSRALNPYRAFCSASVLAKGKKTKSADAEVVEIDSRQILQSLEKSFQKTLELHSKKVNEIKLGKSNPEIFDKLKVKSDGKPTLFTSVAQTSIKGGKNMSVTVFDPKDTKAVISAILASNMNLNPQLDPKNPQILKIPFSGSTADAKQATIKNLKDNYDLYKNGIDKNSLSSLRGDVMKQFKKSTLTDDLKKAVANIEKLHKKFSDQLSEQFKSAEKALAK